MKSTQRWWLWLLFSNPPWLLGISSSSVLSCDPVGVISLSARSANTLVEHSRSFTLEVETSDRLTASCIVISRSITHTFPKAGEEGWDNRRNLRRNSPPFWYQPPILHIRSVFFFRSLRKTFVFHQLHVRSIAMCLTELVSVWSSFTWWRELILFRERKNTGGWSLMQAK